MNAAQLVLCMWSVAPSVSVAVVHKLVATLRLVVGRGALQLFGTEALRLGALQSLCDLTKSVLGHAPKKSTDEDPSHGSVDQKAAILVLELGALDVLFEALAQVNLSSIKVCGDQLFVSVPHALTTHIPSSCFLFFVLFLPGPCRVWVAVEAHPSSLAYLCAPCLRGGSR